MSIISMKQLLEAGAFRPSDQKMESLRWLVHLHGEKQHLYHRPAETVKKIEEAYAFIKEVVESGNRSCS